MQHLEEAIFNQEAEQYFVGCLLSEGELAKETKLQQKNLYLPALKIIFEAIKKVDEKGKPVDLVAIVEELGPRLDHVGGVGYLGELANSIPTTANFKYYENLIFDKWKMRRAVQLANRAKEVVIGDESTEVIGKLIHELEQLNDAGDDEKEFNLRDMLVAMYDEAQEIKGEITGIPSGYRELDYLTSGFQQEDLIVVGARPSVGKTAFCLNVGRNAANQDNAVGVFSLEMGAKQLLNRMISAEGNIDGMKMKNPEALFNEKDWQNYVMAMGNINGLPLHIWDKPGIGMPYIRKEARKFRRKHPGKKVLIIIDYLQLIAGNTKHGGNRTQEIGEISRQLKTMAREEKITVIALSQLSRGVEGRQDKRPMLSDLRESGQIEQDADLIAFLYRDDYYDKESEAENIIEIILAKHRNGPVGTVELAFIKEYNKFVNLERRY